MTNRLSCVARLTSLINPHQCAFLVRLATSDSCTTLTHDVRTLPMAGRKFSTLFLDIKGGFDNLCPSMLCQVLRFRGVNPYLISWTRWFVSGRSYRLLLQGSARVFSPSQSAPLYARQVSPLLFVIYVSRLH